jgi:DNA modification methylase
MDYQDFIESKVTRVQAAGFSVDASQLNQNLKPFQVHIVQNALYKGRYAIFADCGLGKTLMQLEWANKVANYTGRPVLILAPLAVTGQTLEQAAKFGYDCAKLGDTQSQTLITNYEQIEHINVADYSGIVLDESSILKNYTGKYKRLLISEFADTPYKLCCTATPAPNDLNEIGNHSEFLNVLDSEDMRSRWFVRDEGIGNYRLKRHAEKDFYGWIASWATVIRKPSDIGFDDTGFLLPSLHYIEKEVKSGQRDNGKLLNDAAVNATNFNKELKLTLYSRTQEVASLVNESSETFIIWVNQNAEEEEMARLVPEAVTVRGSDKPEDKEAKLLGFANGDYRVLITKKKIAQFGLNFQKCRNQVFASLDFSFEGLYQAVRRSYRFGVEGEVNIYLIATDTMNNVVKSLNQKHAQFEKMMQEITQQVNKKTYSLKTDYEAMEFKNHDYKLLKGDAVDLMKSIPDNSLDLSIFSPPFSNLFTYSDNLRDMGNCEDHSQFFEQNAYMLQELYRIMRPYRLVAVHTKDLPVYKNAEGYAGMYDFTGDYHRAMEAAGFKYHCKITIWIDPVFEMRRTKTQRLLYKTLTKDSTDTGVGMPEYITVFKKWEGSEEDHIPVTNKDKENFPLETWQRWASPVWNDIDRMDVLNNYKSAKDQQDEKHIAPLQLEVIKRLIVLYSNPGEWVFDPFVGVGSTIYESILNNRKGMGIELKDSYFETAKNNIKAAKSLQSQTTLL